MYMYMYMKCLNAKSDMSIFINLRYAEKNENKNINKI